MSLRELAHFDVPNGFSRFLIFRAPKRQSSKVPSPSKKSKVVQEQQQEEPVLEGLSFKNPEYLSNKGEQKRKKWKNLKQILDMPSSFTGPQGFENYTCIPFLFDLLIILFV